MPTLADEKFVTQMRRDHARILRAIAAHDDQKARDAMALHLRNSIRGLETLVRRQRAAGAG